MAFSAELFSVMLAEKPSVARDIARVLGATSRGDGYLHGNGYVVTWAVGHLVIEDPRPYAFGDYLGCPLKRRLNILTKRDRDAIRSGSARLRL